MTIDELKKEAEALGYKLIKKTDRIHLLPCTCGGTRREHWYGYKGKKETETLTCCKCGRSAWGYSEKEAKLNWNKMIEELTK